MIEHFPVPEQYGILEPAEQTAYYRGLALGELAAGILITAEQARMAIYHQEIARYDKMTGTLTESALVEEIVSDQRTNPSAPRGLLFIDLGNFKKANTRGQHIGDDVLRIFGSRLRRVTDKVGRASDRADEFIVYVDLESREGIRTPQETLNLEVQRLRDSRSVLIERHPHLDEGSVRLFVGIGGVEYNNSLSYEENRRLANNEMIIAKALGHQIYGEYRVAED